MSSEEIEGHEQEVNSTPTQEEPNVKQFLDQTEAAAYLGMKEKAFSNALYNRFRSTLMTETGRKLIDGKYHYSVAALELCKQIDAKTEANLSLSGWPMETAGAGHVPEPAEDVTLPGRTQTKLNNATAALLESVYIAVRGQVENEVTAAEQLRAIRLLEAVKAELAASSNRIDQLIHDYLTGA